MRHPGVMKQSCLYHAMRVSKQDLQSLHELKLEAKRHFINNRSLQFATGSLNIDDDADGDQNVNHGGDYLKTGPIDSLQRDDKDYDMTLPSLHNKANGKLSIALKN